MSDAIIKVENLGKKYIIGHQKQERYTALRDVIGNSVKSILQPNNKTRDAKEEFWALKDINFEINQGDRVGIIGRNGAGKSTLLKVLSRITEPTTGQIKIKGRVASLLEVGTGFHPELTGRENIFLNGAILGMGKTEIKQKFDEIVAFAEVEKFLETPVKRYSSGMYVRLAFAVAAHLYTDILLVDEVLAVGDVAFQKKCLGKIHEVSNNGKTVIFVSHQLGLLRNICNKGILICAGKASKFDSIELAIKEYFAQDVSNQQVLHNYKSLQYIKNVYLNQQDGNSNNIFFGDRFLIIVELDNLPDNQLGINLSIKNKLGKLLCTFSTNPHDGFVLPNAKTMKIEFSIPFLSLAPGEYMIDVSLTEPRIKVIEEAENILIFEIHPQQIEGNWAYQSSFGDFFPKHNWRIIEYEKGSQIILDNAQSTY